MGYTHYWRLNAKSGAKRFERAIKDMNSVVKASSLVADWEGNGKPEIKPDEVGFNGQGDDNSHETFLFQPFDCGNFAFCKTAYKPYDVVVTACLAIAADVIQDGIEVSSDGDTEDWEEGAALATRVLGRYVPVPGLIKVNS